MIKILLKVLMAFGAMGGVAFAAIEYGTVVVVSSVKAARIFSEWQQGLTTDEMGVGIAGYVALLATVALVSRIRESGNIQRDMDNPVKIDAGRPVVRLNAAGVSFPIVNDEGEEIGTWTSDANKTEAEDKAETVIPDPIADTLSDPAEDVWNDHPMETDEEDDDGDRFDVMAREWWANCGVEEDENVEAFAGALRDVAAEKDLECTKKLDDACFKFDGSTYDPSAPCFVEAVTGTMSDFASEVARLKGEVESLARQLVFAKPSLGEPHKPLTGDAKSLAKSCSEATFDGDEYNEDNSFDKAMLAWFEANTQLPSGTPPTESGACPKRQLVGDAKSLAEDHRKACWFGEHYSERSIAWFTANTQPAKLTGDAEELARSCFEALYPRAVFNPDRYSGLALMGWFSGHTAKPKAQGVEDLEALAEQDRLRGDPRSGSAGRPMFSTAKTGIEKIAKELDYDLQWNIGAQDGEMGSDWTVRIILAALRKAQGEGDPNQLEQIKTIRRLQAERDQLKAELAGARETGEGVDLEALRDEALSRWNSKFGMGQNERELLYPDIDSALRKAAGSGGTPRKDTHYAYNDGDTARVYDAKTWAEACLKSERRVGELEERLDGDWSDVYGVNAEEVRKALWGLPDWRGDVTFIEGIALVHTRLTNEAAQAEQIENFKESQRSWNDDYAKRGEEITRQAERIEAFADSEHKLGVRIEELENRPSRANWGEKCKNSTSVLIQSHGLIPRFTRNNVNGWDISTGVGLALDALAEKARVAEAAHDDIAMADAKAIKADLLDHGLEWQGGMPESVRRGLGVLAEKARVAEEKCGPGTSFEAQYDIASRALGEANRELDSVKIDLMNAQERNRFLEHDAKRLQNQAAEPVVEVREDGYYEASYGDDETQIVKVRGGKVYSAGFEDTYDLDAWKFGDKITMPSDSSADGKGEERSGWWDVETKRGGTKYTRNFIEGHAYDHGGNHRGIEDDYIFTAPKPNGQGENS